MNTPQGINRRTFLKVSALGAATFALPRWVAAEVSSSRPNVVLIIADDWGWGHAGFFGDKTAQTPNIDRLAREGLVLPRMYCAAPTCTASRSSLLTGQMFYRLGTAAQLHGPLDKAIPSYPEILQQAGYAVGLTGKGLGPGDPRNGGREHNPAGPLVPDLQALLDARQPGQPFCFWFGSYNPHRPYNQKNIEKPDPSQVPVPSFLPDTPEVRADLADYYAEIQAFDAQIGGIIATLEKAGELDNTIIVVTSDNGMPFPRGKLNLYDSGTRMPAVVRWGNVIRPGRVYDGLLSHTDFAPTFLQAAGLPVPEDMTGHSLLPLFRGVDQAKRDFVVVGRERHAVEYPTRGIHTEDFLLIRNYSPELSPAGSDRGPTREFMTNNQTDPRVAKAWALFSDKRPAVELFDKRKDPDQLTNVADDPAYASVRKELEEKLDAFLKETGDPRALGKGDVFLSYPDFSKKKGTPATEPQAPAGS